MPTISKELAEKEIARLKTQKRPKAYCVVRYQNRLEGDSEKMAYSGYAICYGRDQYDALLQSTVVGGIDILWASARCQADIMEEEDDEDAAWAALGTATLFNRE